MTTMQDVARQAGVSLSTVSYALNGNRPIAQETRDRIQAAIDELGYRRNAAARSLAARRSHVLALVLPTVAGGLSGTLGEFAESAAQTARDAGYHLVIWPFDRREHDEVRDLVGQGQADGVLLMEVALDDARVEALASSGVPFTLIGRTRDPEGTSYVDIDFERTITDAVEHLADLGHRTVGFVNHSQRSEVELYGPTVRARDAFLAAAEERHLAPVHVTCDESPVAGRRAALEILVRAPRTTAIITMNESATFGVTSLLRERRIEIPRDMSVVAVVTSSEVGAMYDPPLTSYLAPGRTLGRYAVEELLAALGGPPRRDAPRLVACALAPGGSTGPAPS
ncbi:LacI family DNA-binding transcriptional regulator [Luteimicrobium subarcticum]|uniref:LacI family transcriptional regulator n=1 Tax=Luteimicrobium subarcticum TaxID=620910 RepID=A0A2M8WR57_9MICO|nr:substrate-binding domain-containing protein [Luteimicrobium subarcticum]PJI93409.1 LacI family transcriptional regulator [Luteimicrobium subarcticum]